VGEVGDLQDSGRRMPTTIGVAHGIVVRAPVNWSAGASSAPSNAVTV
jgi:hypothetical protein